jgi:hypothetical protein
MVVKLTGVPKKPHPLMKKLDPLTGFGHFVETVKRKQAAR